MARPSAVTMWALRTWCIGPSGFGTTMLRGESGPSGALSMGTGPSAADCCLGGGFGGGARGAGSVLCFLEGASW
eukprot:10898058-Lingulodinium_polyedra.AAC.1